MTRFVQRLTVPCSASALYQWHASGGAFQRLAPPWEHIRVRSWEGGEATQGMPQAQQFGDISTGATVTIQTRIGPIPATMVAKHTDHAADSHFVDEMIKGPFARWRHEHRFIPDGEQAILEDSIDYALPAGALGQALGGRFAQRQLEQLFAFRHRRTLQDLLRHQQFADRPRMTIAVTGASGFVGRQLVAFLRGGGHRVRAMVRRAPEPGSDQIAWRPAEGFVDRAALEGVDAIIHLAGESILGRWTAAKKARILQSRVQGTRAIAEAAAALQKKPAVLISTSAVGIYGDQGDTLLPEDADKDGDGFLADVCRQWEAAAQPARDAGIRVVHPRLGVVLSGGGGALSTMLPAFSLGLGGPIGSGKQWMSWIGLDDLVGIYHHALFTDTLQGAVNAVAPGAVTSRDYGRALGAVLRRPAFMPLPTPAVRLIMGQMGEEMLLFSIRASSQKLQDSQFSFLHQGLDGVLRAELGR